MKSTKFVEQVKMSAAVAGTRLNLSQIVNTTLLKKDIVAGVAAI